MASIGQDKVQETQREFRAQLVVAGLPMNLQVIRVRPSWEHGCQGPSTTSLSNPYAGNVGVMATLEETANRDAPKRIAWMEVDWEWRNEWGTVLKEHRCHHSQPLNTHLSCLHEWAMTE
jgi:hypothetical protein